MEVKFGPNSQDEPNLLYKLQRKVKAFNTLDNLPNRGYNLVTSSSKYALVFVGAPNGSLLVYYLKQLLDKESEDQHLVVKLNEKPTHIAVSCDQELLSVTGGQLLCVYKVADFQNQNVVPIVTLKLDVNPATNVSSLQWNPCIPDSIAIAFQDGTLIACQVNTAQIKKVQSKCRCLCWSPKGKQFVTGNNDGTLTQYKPDLTPAKNIPAPNIFEGSPTEVLAVYWISTFQFAVVYKNAADNSRPAVSIINTPKAGQPSCSNYEDICYSMGSSRPWYYYLQGIAPWNIIISSSSNSIEMATLGSADGANWQQWCQADEARPELPLTDKKQENYPVGVWIDTSAIHQIPWGENDILPPMPILLVISQTGLLTIFNIINLNKQAAQVCSPPQPIALPAGAMTSAIPDEAPQAAAPQIVAPKPQNAIPPQPSAQPVPPVASSTALFGSNSVLNQTVKPAVAQPTVTPTFTPSVPPQIVGQNQPVEEKPTPQTVPKSTAATAPKAPVAPAVVQPTAQMQETYAAMKAEQERIKATKANQELKSMLVKEVNDFQMELYNFMVNIGETQLKIQHDIQSMDANMYDRVTDAEELKRDLCSLEELRNAIVQLKLEMVRSCAVVAEARTHADAKDIQQWTQADPLTTKRVANVKKLAYYVQNQVQQAHRALDHKWNNMPDNDAKYKQIPRMIRPILDDVYQPLVKQQEILSRQQVVLRSLKNTLKEVDAVPLFKSTTLLRSTPFKKDPLSKLTKNILNMSIEPQTKTKEPFLSAQKLDTLRDILSNHKTTKIKPVNVELRQQLSTIRMKYEKSLKEEAVQQPVPQVQIKKEPLPYEPPARDVAPLAPVIKPEPTRIVPAAPINVPTFTPASNNTKPAIPGIANVARTLFTDEIKSEPKPPQEKPKTSLGWSQLPDVTQKSLTSPTSSTTSATVNTKSVLKDLLQNKQAQVAVSAASKAEANMFFGQKICSPTAFSFSSSNAATTTASPMFTAKPISDISNMFNKFQTTQMAEIKPTLNISHKSSETGESDAKKLSEPKKTPSVFDPKPFAFANKPVDTKVQDVPKTVSNEGPKIEAKVQETLKSENKQEVPKTDVKSQDVPKSDVKNQDLQKPDAKPIKVVLKAAEKSKENIPQDSQKPQPAKKEVDLKPLNNLNANNASVTPATINIANFSISGESQKPTEVKTATEAEAVKEPEKTVSATASSASSIFGAANATTPTESKPQSFFNLTVSSSSPTGSIFGTPQPAAPTSPTDGSATPPLFTPAPTSTASSIFSAAVATQPSPTQSGSLFGTTTQTPAASVFGTTSSGSLFGTATTTSSSVFATNTTPSAFSGAVEQSTVFSSSPTKPTSVFAAAVLSSSSTGSIFGTATTQASVFGTPTSTTNVFGTATTQASVFGTPTTTAQSVFGTAASPSSVFGGAASTAQSVFASGTATTQSSVFGTATTQASVFGSSAPTSQGSIFGSPSTQTSVFGTQTQSTQSSVFGTPPQTTQASLFGSPPATTAQGGSLFGGAESNLFAAASISTTSAPSQATGGSIFGSSSGSVFGSTSGNSNIFGGNSTFSQSSPTAASIFGGGAAAFGQKQTTNFWSGGSSTANAGFGSGFGQQPSTQASSIFGGGSTGSFSAAPTPAQPFGSPQQSAFGTADNKPSIFSSPQPQAAPGFGASPVFGSKPAFGQSTGFGSPPSTGFGSFGGFNKSPSQGFGAPASFGGGATFGGSAFGNTSPSKVFGGSSPVAGFGSPTQSNATFESLATQNTLTFGNLAQQSGQPPQAAPAFGASPAFTGWRG